MVQNKNLPTIAWIDFNWFNFKYNLKTFSKIDNI